MTDVERGLLNSLFDQATEANNARIDREALEAERDAALARVAELEQLLTTIKWRSADKDNMEFAASITCWQMDDIRAALKGVAELEGKTKRQRHALIMIAEAMDEHITDWTQGFDVGDVIPLLAGTRRCARAALAIDAARAEEREACDENARLRLELRDLNHGHTQAKARVEELEEALQNAVWLLEVHTGPDDEIATTTIAMSRAALKEDDA